MGLFYSNAVNGQEENESRNNEFLMEYPNSNNATRLAQVSKVPVNLSTGQINYNIPIASLNGGVLEWPISLSYSYNGFRLEQSTGELGLGWGLNGVGVITRKVNDLPDDHRRGIRGIESERVLIEKYRNGEELALSELKKIGSGEYDLEYDEYIVSAGKLNFSFQLLDDGSIVTRTVENVKVVWHEGDGTNLPGIPSTHDTFEITDSQGNIYNFTEAEHTSNSYNYGSEGNGIYEFTDATYISALYLTSIVLKNNKRIDFTYTSGNSLSYSFSEIYERSTAYGGVIWTVDGDEKHYGALNESKTSSSSLHIGKFLSSVAYGDQYITIERQLENCNYCANDPLIKSIKVINPNADDYQLDHQMTYLFNYSGEESNRQTLTSIELENYDPTVQNEEVYGFQYFSSSLAPSTITNKENYPLSMDHWGFYNGANNVTLIADKGANRNANFTSTKIGALIEINHRTGGTTEIEYEQNEIAVNKSEAHNFVPMTRDGKLTYTHEGNTDPAAARKRNSYKWVFEAGTYIKYRYNAEVEKAGGQIQMRMNILEEVESQEISSYAPSIGVSFEGDRIDSGCSTGFNACESGSMDEWKLIAPGEYEIIFESEGGGLINASITIEMVRLGNTTSNMVNVPVGGIRVKKTTNITGDDRLETFYKYEKENGESSGKEMDKMRFSNEFTYYAGYQYSDGGSIGGGILRTVVLDLPATRFSSSSINPLNSYSGSPVYYSRVEEFTAEEFRETQVESEEIVSEDRFPELTELYFVEYTSETGREGMYPYYANGKTVSYFYSPMNISSSYPRRRVEYDGLIGKMYKQEVFGHVQGSEDLKLISETRWGYDVSQINQPIRHYELQVANKATIAFTPNWVSVEDLDRMERSRFSLKTQLTYGLYKAKLNDMSSVQYFVNNADGSHKTDYTKYEYDNYFQVKSITKLDEFGLENKTEFEYPYDVVTPENQLLIENNDLETLVRIKQYSGNQLLSTKTNEYQQFAEDRLNGQHVVLPKKYKQQIASGPEITTTEILGYNNYDKVLEYTTKAGDRYTVLYGYDAELIVAKISNVALDTVLGAMGLTTVSEFEALTEAEMIVKLNLLRTTISELKMENYYHIEGIGLKQKIDINGNSSFYEYDDENRLKTIKDQDGNLIQKYDYTYHN